MHGSSLCVYASMYRCVCMQRVYMYVRVFLWVYMHGSSLYVYASVYRCICMDRVYMYKRVFIGVCMRQVYMYTQVIHKCICIHY